MKTRSICLPLLLALFCSAISSAQWEPVNSGLTTYRFRLNEGIVVSPNIDCANVYSGPSTTDSIKGCVPAGTTGSIMFGPHDSFWYVSFSTGIGGWCAAEDLTHPLPEVLCLAANGPTLFAGTSRNAFRSTDNGTNWTQMNSDWIIPYTDYWTVRAFFITSGTNIYAKNAYAPFLSTDNGTSWNPLAPYGSGIYLLAASTTCLFATKSNGSTLRSTNNGIVWDTITCPGSLAIIDTNLFAEHSNGDVDLSTDNGTTWKNVWHGCASEVVSYFCASGKYLFDMEDIDGTHNFVSRKLWTGCKLVCAPAMTFPPSYVPCSTTGAVSASGADVLLNYGDNFFSTNSGTDWEVLDLPSGVSSPAPFVTLGTNLFVGGTGVWRTSLSDPLPVRLASFTVATPDNNGVSLTWKTLTETNVYGFYIQRDGADIAFIAGHGTTLQSQTYSYTDNPSPGQHQYRLRQVDLDGAVTFSESVTTGVSAPQKFTLEQNYPNPFNPSTTIRYALPARSHVALSVYNTLGEDVIDLVNGDVDAGYHEATFDGSRMASGVYFYRIEAGSFVETKKLILIR